MPFPVAAAIQGGLGIGQAVLGLVKDKKLRKQAAELEKNRPKFKESPYVKDQLALAESELSSGLSANAERAYEEGLDRDLSTSLNTILKSGGSVNNVSQLFDSSSEGRQRLTLLKENLRLNQINNLVRAQQASEEQRQQAFQFNDVAPYFDKAQAIAEGRRNVQNLIFGGVNALGSAGQSFFAGKRQEALYDKYFGVNPPTQEQRQVNYSNYAPSVQPIRQPIQNAAYPKVNYIDPYLTSNPGVNIPVNPNPLSYYYGNYR